MFKGLILAFLYSQGMVVRCSLLLTLGINESPIENSQASYHQSQSSLALAIRGGV